jgi:rubrerythrin
MTERLSEHAAGRRDASVDPYSLPRPARLELRCMGCGFGAVTSATPTQCPMCGGLDWDFDDWRPFSSRGVEHH